jgi:hypothetical protein
VTYLPGRMRAIAFGAIVTLLIVGGLAGPAFGLRVRNPSASLVLADPTVTCSTSGSVRLTWTDSASSATGTYRVMSLAAGKKQNAWSAGGWLGNVRSTIVTVPLNSTYSFVIEAKTSTVRNSNKKTVTAACPTVDTQAPSIPSGVSGSATSCSAASLSWSASTDTGGSGLKAYNVYRNNGFLKQVTGTSTTDTGLAGGSTTTYDVSAIDNANNESLRSTQVTVSTPACPDVTPPTAPAPVSATPMSCTTVSVSWGASADAGGSGLKGYNLYRKNVFV